MERDRLRLLLEINNHVVSKLNIEDFFGRLRLRFAHISTIT